MRKKNPLILFMFLSVSLVCKASPGDTLITPQKYIDTYKDLAISEMKRTGIPASITLAQGLLESGCGNSYLAKVANNHFGIKCKTGWAGRSVRVDDDELQECFRAYDKAEDSYRDHSDFLTTQTRYAGLFQLEPTDYKGWAYGLKADGYATNPKYPEELIDKIEKYGLYQYDAGNTRVPPAGTQANRSLAFKNIAEPGLNMSFLTMNQIPAYIIKTGDTYETIADANTMMRWEVRTYNDLTTHDNLEPGTIIYLKPKRRRAKEDYHTVKPGEGMYYISQAEGIKLRLLYKWNLMRPGEEPQPGEKLNLRHKRTALPNLLPAGTVIARHGVKMTLTPEPVVKRDSALRNRNLLKKEQKDSVKITPEKEKQSFEGRDSIGRYHIVLDGETIYGIAKNYRIPYKTLESWNHLKGNVVSGQKIYISKPKRPLPASVESKELHQAQSQARAQEPMPDTVTHYTVKHGETLYAISAKFHVPVDSLLKLNHLSSYSLSEGQTLIVKRPASGTESNSEPEYHTVVAGETLYSISKQFRVTVDDLETWNKLDDATISIGQKLRVRKE